MLQGFTVAGTQGFVPQGGTSGGCGIPADADAITANVVAITPSTTGYLVGWRTNDPIPHALFINFNRGSTTSTGTVLPLLAGVQPGASQLDLESAAATVDAAVDVTGYYVPPIWAQLDLDGNIEEGSRYVDSGFISTGEYSVTFDRDVRDCAVTAVAKLSNGTVAAVQFDPSVDNGLVVYTTRNGTPINSDTWVTVVC